jgi:uncharacterized protein (DUF1501 family)
VVPIIKLYREILALSFISDIMLSVTIIVIYAVNKGIYGEPPALNSLDNNGNLKYTVDFRSVYATVLDRWVGASSKDVLGGTFDRQHFLPSTS